MSRESCRSRIPFPMAACIALFLMVLSAGVTVDAQSRFRPFSPTNSQEETQVELGRLLFWDPILSGHRDTSCATCHHPDFAYTDGRDIARGTGAVGLGPARRDVSEGIIPVVKRNSPTILNAAFNGLDQGGNNRNRIDFDDSPANPRVLRTVNQQRAPMFWDSRVRSLELQALEPLKAFEEMRGNAYPEEAALDSVVARLRANPEYVQLFEEAFGTGAGIEASHIGAAIAAFERTLVAVNSPFDRYMAGDLTAMTPQQIRGFDEFDDAGCEDCHEGPMFSDFDLNTIGIPENSQLAEPDRGANNNFEFRTPSLRNVALTAPYMHNGAFTTLDEVLEHYDNGVSRNPNIATNGRGGRNAVAQVEGDFRRVDNMSTQEMRDIIAFLHALTDEDFDRTIPARLPSGLTVGGSIYP